MRSFIGPWASRFSTPPAEDHDLPPAAALHELPEKQLFNSMNSGFIIHRSAQLKNEYRTIGREFARVMAETMTVRRAGIASVGFYEEVFGVQDRIHWLIHVRQLRDYHKLLAGFIEAEGARRLNQVQIPEELGGGNWEKMFVDGSVVETALIAHVPGGFGTEQQ